MKIKQSDQAGRYATQSRIVQQALAAPDHALDELLRLMRATGQASVYFAGTRLDHDHCFGSSEVGLLFSVLPEDATKAAEPGYHPGGTEVYTTFQGSLMMECLEQGQVTQKSLPQHAVPVIPPGQCHRVRRPAETRAASLIVKTNPGFQPGVIRCDHCTYYPAKTACPLFQRWTAESQT